MANQILTFMTRDDELALMRVLERDFYEVYPRRVPPDWKPFRATLANFDKLPAEEIYFVASDIGPAMVDKIKRGPDKGFWRVDEVRSPVLFWERNTRNEEGEMVSGQLWAELEITQQTGRRNAAPDKFRVRVLELTAWVSKNFRRADPKPFMVGPAAAREVKQGTLKLRENAHWGREVFIKK
jgi:hypothetical protein